mmetsp:Transcript_23974/g.49517  ORF Transcript_23974/g.49517 Transcript_23974/m.49517 type:complete len:513 (-) Transcript_23974:383-1921(-)
MAPPAPEFDLIAEMSFASSSHPASSSTLSSMESSTTAAAASDPAKQTANAHANEAVVMVTPYSTGCCIALDVQRRGYTLICLWNRDFCDTMKQHVPTSCSDLSYHAELTESETLDGTIASLESCADASHLKIVGVICGGEAGVDLADALSEGMGMVTNGTDIPNRRDKKVQQELIAARGMRSIRQAGGKVFDDVEKFLKAESYPVVVKPVDSAGSDGVKLCHTFDEAREHFHHLLSTQMVNGGTCYEVLCQEYLKGKEYVVDHVSRDGEHKTVMCWVYDKRPANGATFVYHGVIPVDSESAEAKAMIPYVRDVLDALGVRNGPSHGEVIITEDGPCLVEMNCRAHGGDGNWQSLCRELCGGYTQVNATVDSYLDVERFHALPNKPPSPFLASGQEVDLVSFQAGTVIATPGFDKIRALDSFVLLESHVKPGVRVSKTIDLVTDIGNIILMHHDGKVLEKDIAFIRSIEKIPGALFELEVDSDEEEEEEEGDVVFPILTRSLSTPKSHRYTVW